MKVYKCDKKDCGEIYESQPEEEWTAGVPLLPSGIHLCYKHIREFKSWLLGTADAVYKKKI